MTKKSVSQKSKISTMAEVAVALQAALITADVKELHDLYDVMCEYESNDLLLVKNLRHAAFETLWNAMITGVDEGTLN